MCGNKQYDKIQPKQPLYFFYNIIDWLVGNGHCTESVLFAELKKIKLYNRGVLFIVFNIKKTLKQGSTVCSNTQSSVEKNYL